jgi:tetratricopeptide (TPR) repeat protein
MAWLVLHMKKFEEASVYLKECQQLYPENPSAYLAREQLGECFRQLAKKEAIEEKANQVRASEVNDDRRMTFVENARVHKQARVRWLTMAVKVFQDLADDLGKAKSPSVQEQQLIRRAWFGIGECLLDNDEVGESMRVFGEVQKKYRKTLEGFYACLRICHMADVMQMRPLPKEQIDFARDRAEEALRLMGEDLPTIAEDDEMFQHPDAPSRDEWQRWRLAMQQRLRPAPKNESPLPVFP